MLVCSAHANHPHPPPKTLLPNPRNPKPKTLTFRKQADKTPEPLTSGSSSETLPSLAIKRIADKLRALGFTEDSPTRTPTPKPDGDSLNAGAGEIFIPLPGQLSKYRVGHTLDPSWSTPENPVPGPGSRPPMAKSYELNTEAEQDKEVEKRRVLAGKVPTLAELSLTREEQKRLTRIGLAERRRLKVGKAGITEGVINGIHERWRRAEVVNVVCEDLCKMNMKRTHYLLELKTGGLVVWRSGSRIILYRGANYKYPYFISKIAAFGENSADALPRTNMDCGMVDIGESCSSDASSSRPSLSPTPDQGRPSLVQGVGSPNRVRFQLPGEEKLIEEADSLLDGLGPRFREWWGYEPLPVDGDLLPAFVPGYRRPFRLLPYGVKPTLTSDEMNALKRLSRPLPCHFALGRTGRLMGLADSIVKLWEKCEIAKIAVKRGVLDTSSKLMAEELKSLTGGTLLGRDRECILLYRGKDFLPSSVLSDMKKRKHRMPIGKSRDNTKSCENAGDREDCSEVSDTRELHSTKEQSNDISKQLNIRSSEANIQMTSLKGSMALEKKTRAEKILAEMEKTEQIQKTEVDIEGITEEERYMLRKVGLKMKPFLLMGRRGAFSGTVENIHLHWKYRELVKVICKEKSLEAAHRVAKTLEAESGGNLVAVERVAKGYAIIIYRGKNYIRPARLRPSTLLSKKEALKHYVETQRRKSLKLDVLKLSENIDHLNLQLIKDREAHNARTSDKLNYQVKEEMDTLGSAILAASNSELNSSDQSDPLMSHCSEETFVHIADDLGANSSINSSDDIPIPVNEPPINQVNQIPEDETQCESDSKQTHTVLYKGKVKLSDASIYSPFNDQLPEDTTTSYEDMARSYSQLNQSELIELISTSVKGTEKKTSKVVHLSNRDRLLLRKQALKMKRRPVLAVGKSNVVTGIAKQIKAHFERHPLAVVNVKGRAKGTSVQEVVSKLEQETGAVLVSQEPNKVILYRGWGAEEEHSHRSKKNAQDFGESSVTQQAVSPDLMAAIRFECGLQQYQEEKSRLSTNT